MSEADESPARPATYRSTCLLMHVAEMRTNVKYTGLASARDSVCVNDRFPIQTEAITEIKTIQCLS